MAKLYGKNSAVDFASANLMSFGKSFSRLNGQPLDKSEVWYDNLQALRDYALTDAAYVGQKVVFVDSTNNTVTHYGIEVDGSLKELGASPIGDEKSIHIADDGTISLFGVTGLDFVKKDGDGNVVEDEDGNEVKVTYQPLMTENGLTWIIPSSTTVESLAEEIEALKGRATALESIVGKAATDEDEATGLVKSVEDLDGRLTDAENDIKAKVASLTAADSSVVVGNTATDPNIKVQISGAEGNALSLKDDGLIVTIPAAAEYSIVKDPSATDGYSATYHLTKDGVNVGTAINIPKDMVVQSGAVVTNPEGKDAGTYIKLILANADNSELFIPVDTLIEYVTSGSAVGDTIVIAVSDDHKITATITDGTITKSKLSAELVSEIEHTNRTVLDGITAEKVESWDNKVDAEANKSLVSDELIEKLQNINASAQVNAIDSVDEDEFSLDTNKKLSIKEISHSKVSGLADAISGVIGQAPTNTGTSDEPKWEGATGIYTKVYTKEEIASLIRDVTGGESAAGVRADFDAYVSSNNTRVGNIETALDSKIAGITINGEAAAPVNGIVDIPLTIATADKAGIVKSSSEENKVSVSTEGIMEVNSLNVNKLVQTDGEFLILNGGSASLM